MLGFLTRILRVFWRPETEGSGGAVVLTFPSPAAETFVQSNPLPAAPVAFLKRSGETAPTIQKPATRHLAARLQSVQRLNSPTSRSCRKAAISPAPQLKSSRVVNPGVVLNRLATHSRRTSAEIVDLGVVRRTRQVEATDWDIAAIFN
jgi:hypothetical protein